MISTTLDSMVFEGSSITKQIRWTGQGRKAPLNTLRSSLLTWKLLKTLRMGLLAISTLVTTRLLPLEGIDSIFLAMINARSI